MLYSCIEERVLNRVQKRRSKVQTPHRSSDAGTAKQHRTHKTKTPKAECPVLYSKKGGMFALLFAKDEGETDCFNDFEYLTALIRRSQGHCRVGCENKRGPGLGTNTMSQQWWEGKKILDKEKQDKEKN